MVYLQKSQIWYILGGIAKEIFGIFNGHPVLLWQNGIFFTVWLELFGLFVMFYPEQSGNPVLYVVSSFFQCS
jgi:hypothetical protein